MKLRLSWIAAGLGAVSVGATVLVATSGAATATTNPPWEPDPNSVGTLTFFNASGTQVTSGNLVSSPIAAFIQASAPGRATDTKATLYAYTPKFGVPTGSWSGEQLSKSTTYPNASAPAPLNASPLPLVTGGATDESLATYMGNFPNTDTTNAGYINAFQLRVKTTGSSSAASTYDEANIMVSGVTKDGSGNVNGGTWTQINPPAGGPSPTATATTPPPAPTTLGNLVLLPAPVRALNSKNTGGAFSPQSERAVSLTGAGVPAGAKAALVSVQAFEESGHGYAAVLANGLAWQGTSSLTWWTGNSNITATIVTALDSSGNLKIHNGPSSTQYIVDVVGYYL